MRQRNRRREKDRKEGREVYPRSLFKCCGDNLSPQESGGYTWAVWCRRSEGGGSPTNLKTLGSAAIKSCKSEATNLRLRRRSFRIVAICLFLIIYPVIITILAKITRTHIAHYLGNTAHRKLISCWGRLPNPDWPWDIPITMSQCLREAYWATSAGTPTTDLWDDSAFNDYLFIFSSPPTLPTPTLLPHKSYQKQGNMKYYSNFSLKKKERERRCIKGILGFGGGVEKKLDG